MSDSYDLTKMEDIFACLEVITMARGALYPVDPDLSARLEKVSDALSAFSLVISEGFAQPQATEPLPPQQPSSKKEFSLDANDGNNVQPVDLMSDFPQAGKKEAQKEKSSSYDDDDGIVDILTGEKIR